MERKGASNLLNSWAKACLELWGGRGRLWLRALAQTMREEGDGRRGTREREELKLPLKLSSFSFQENELRNEKKLSISFFYRNRVDQIKTLAQIRA